MCVSYTRIKVTGKWATFADVRLAFPDFFIGEVGWIERPLKEVLAHALGMQHVQLLIAISKFYL